MINSDIIPSDKINLVIFEMGASDVPNGPWSPHSSGAVLLVLKLRKLQPLTVNMEKLTDADSIRINNYAGYGSPQCILGSITINSVEKRSITVSGKITFKSEKPSTLQEICLNNTIIPLYTVQEYLDLHKDKDVSYVMLRQEKYRELLNSQGKHSGQK